MTTKTATACLGRLEVRGFIERALLDFELMEAFERRPPAERAACLVWLNAANGARDEEARVSKLLDCLEYGESLPSLSRAVAGVSTRF